MPHECRESLIHDRCLACGSLLPCALHDREMKRGMLEEKEGKPTFRKTWEYKFNRGIATHLEKTEHGWLFVDADCVYTIGNDLRACDTLDWEKATVPDAYQQFSHFVHVGDVYLSPNGNKELWWDQAQSEWRVRSFQLKGVDERQEVVFLDMRNNCWTEDDAWVSIRKARGDDYNSNPLDVLGGDDKIAYYLATFESKFLDGLHTYEFVTAPYSESESARYPRGVFSQEDGTVLIFEENSFSHGMDVIYGKPPSNSNLSDKWSFICRDHIVGDFSSFPIVQRLSSSRYLISSEKRLTIIEHDHRKGHFIPYPVFASEVETEGIKSTAIGLLDESTFVAVTVNHELLLFEERQNKSWSHKFIANLRNEISRIIVESPTLFEVCYADGLVERWEIPTDELRAYHERQISQTNTQPLPSDI